MSNQASAFYPLETGGILMGYWVNTQTVVAASCIGAGPNANHTQHSFDPDQMWQKNEVARRYTESDRIEAYLGDWHTHPDTLHAYLSRKDRSAKLRIAKHPAARCPTPIMSVVSGSPENWNVAAWIGRPTRRFGLFDKIELEDALLRFEK